MKTSAEFKFPSLDDIEMKCTQLWIHHAKQILYF